MPVDLPGQAWMSAGQASLPDGERPLLVSLALLEQAQSQARPRPVAGGEIDRPRSLQIVFQILFRFVPALEGDQRAGPLDEQRQTLPLRLLLFFRKQAGIDIEERLRGPLLQTQ